MKSQSDFPFAPHAIESYRLRDHGWRMMLQRRIGVGLVALGFALGFAVARWL